MQLNLNVHFWVGFLVTVASAIAGGTVHLTNAIPADWIPVVTAWSSIIAMIGGGYLTVLSQTGTPPSPPAVPPAAQAAGNAVIAALAIGLSALAMGWSMPAQAQGRQPLPAARAAPCDPLRLLPGCQSGDAKGIDDLVSKLDTLALPDFEFALAQAKAAGNEVTMPCWQAWVDLIKARQSAALGPDGQPLPLPEPHVITAIERISELLAILRPDSKISLACVQIANVAGKDAATVVTGILSGGALGLFKLPIPLP